KSKQESIKARFSISQCCTTAYIPNVPLNISTLVTLQLAEFSV
ncbi:4955_t:CDS:2, partial [Entrophospora sp. SA101]